MKLPEELQFIANARMVQKTTDARLDGRGLRHHRGDFRRGIPGRKTSGAGWSADRDGVPKQ